METRSEIIKKLQVFLNDKVNFAYVFGSVARDQLTDESDIDCAVHMKNFGPGFNKLDFMIAISSEFSRSVDVIFLNDCDLIITMQVLTNGIVVVNNDPRMMIEHKALKSCQYIDYKMSRKIIEDNLMRGRIYG